VVDLDAKTCPCCQGELHQIGEDKSERLDMARAQFRVIVTRRPKHACRACEDGVLQAEASARLIEGGLPTEATIAEVSGVQICRSSVALPAGPDLCPPGIALNRSTLADWVGHAAFHLRPLHERLLTVLRAKSKLFAGETTVPVLDPGRGRTKIRQLWAYAAEDRLWAALDPPGIAKRSGCSVILPALRAPCRSMATTSAPIASEALKHIAAFYAIEKEIRGRSAEERRLVRQQKSRPLADVFEVWLRAKLALFSQNIKLSEAIRYAFSRWQGLARFIDDGRVELDNNTVERSIRGIKLSRRSALFAGPDVGAS